MKIQCGICGKEMVVGHNLLEGQHVLCPHCGGKSGIRKPTRIELPTGTMRRCDKESVQPEWSIPNDGTDKASDRPVDKKKPLRVIRNEGASSTVPNQEFSRRLHMSEEHVRFYEEMKDMDRRRKMREKMQGVLMLVAVVLCAVGVYWYVGYRKEKRHQAEIAFTEEKNRLEAERAENERREKALRDSAEKTARETRLAEEKRQREMRQKEEERVKAERAKIENELLAARVLYRKTCSLFSEGDFHFIQDLPTNALPGTIVGTFYYLLPFLDNNEIVVCSSTTNGIESVCRLDDTGKRTTFEADSFLASLQGKDYLMIYDDHVYFQSKRKKPHIAQISKKEVVDLTKEFFGDIAPEVKRLDVDPEGLRFEIVFIPKGSKKIIIADNVEYGVEYSLEKVREAIEDAFPMRRTTVSTAKKKKFKRTVVFWDGAHIKRGVDGVTYVPRVKPPVTYGRMATLSGPGWLYDREWRNENKRISRAEYTHAHWQSLSEEAKKQENAEQQFNAQEVESHGAQMQKAASRAEQTYMEKINRIFDEGTLYFRARIE